MNFIDTIKKRIAKEREITVETYGDKLINYLNESVGSREDFVMEPLGAPFLKRKRTIKAKFFLFNTYLSQLIKGSVNKEFREKVFKYVCDKMGFEKIYFGKICDDWDYDHLYIVFKKEEFDKLRR